MKLKGMQFALTMLMLVGLLWGSVGAVLAQAAEAGVFEDLDVQPGVQFEIPIEVRAVTDLYAIDIELRFDPVILQAEDANPAAEGIQAGLGTFLDAGLMLINEIDNAEGVLRFAMTQVNPAEPKSGDGIVLVLYFFAQTEGETELEVSFLEASTRFGEEIVLEAVDGRVTVFDEASVVESTPIPTQDPGLATQIPTLAPTEVPTQTPVPTEVVPETAEPEPEALGEEETEPGEEAAYPVEVEVVPEATAAYPADDAADEDDSGTTILDYWWAVLIVVLLAGGLGVYLAVSKKRPAADV